MLNIHGGCAKLAQPCENCQLALKRMMKLFNFIAFILTFVKTSFYILPCLFELLSPRRCTARLFIKCI